MLPLVAVVRSRSKTDARGTGPFDDLMLAVDVPIGELKVATMADPVLAAWPIGIDQRYQKVTGTVR